MRREGLFWGNTAGEAPVSSYFSFKPSFPLTTNPNIGVVYEVRADVVGVLSPGDSLQTEVMNIVATDLSTAQPAIITPGLPLPPQILTF